MLGIGARHELQDGDGQSGDRRGQQSSPRGRPANWPTLCRSARAATAERPPPLYFADGDAGQRMIEASMTAIGASFSTLEAEFHAEADGCRSEWRCSRQMPTQYVAQEARAADVIVTGQSQNIVM